MADGYSEEEIALKLGKPKEIALQFSSVKEKPQGKATRAVILTGLIFADIFVCSFFIVMLAWVFVLGITSIATAVTALSLIANPLIPSGLISLPFMPYTGAILLAVTVAALSVLIAVVTIYSWALTIQLYRAYMRWHKNTLKRTANILPLPCIRL